MSTVNLHVKNVPNKAWIIVSLGIFFLMFAIAYSFIRGWSKIEKAKHTIEKKK